MFFHEDSHMNNENIYHKIIYCSISDYLEHHVCLVVMAVMILNHLCHASHSLFWTEWEKPLLYHCKSKVFLCPLCVFYSYIHCNIINKSYLWTRLQFLHCVKALHKWHGDDLCTNICCCDYIFIHWCCCLPVPCVEQICGIPLNSISPSTCSQSERPSSTRTFSH